MELLARARTFGRSNYAGGQDWGCPWDAGAAAVMRNIQAMNCGQSVSYMCENENPTDRNLIELFHSIGFDILTDDSRLFFTNFVMGYRVKGTSGNFKKSWAMADAEYFRRLVEIIRPRILLCLGKDTLKSVLGCFDSTVSNKDELQLRYRKREKSGGW